MNRKLRKELNSMAIGGRIGLNVFPQDNKKIFYIGVAIFPFVIKYLFIIEFGKNYSVYIFETSEERKQFINKRVLKQ